MWAALLMCGLEEDISEILESVENQEEKIMNEINECIEKENHYEYIKSEEIDELKICVNERDDPEVPNLGLLSVLS